MDFVLLVTLALVGTYVMLEKRRRRLASGRVSAEDEAPDQEADPTAWVDAVSSDAGWGKIVAEKSQEQVVRRHPVHGWSSPKNTD